MNHSSAEGTGPAPSASTPRYWAFISYSHVDKRWGGWLHRSLETYRVPGNLAGTEGRDGPIPKRAHPVFRDREELPTASDLGEGLEKALADSRYLIVICSPNAAQSRWVNEEILHFKRLGRSNRILCLIVDGEPNASDDPKTAHRECFPPAIRYALGPDGELSDQRVEPIAADVRSGADKKKDALLKLAAGVLGVGFDQLKQRDAQRRQRRLMAVAVASFCLVALMAVLTTYALLARAEADRQRKTAELRLAYFSSERGAALYELGRYDEADEAYRSAGEMLDALDRSTLETTLGRLSLFRARPRPLFVHTELAFDLNRLLAISPDDRSLLVKAAAHDDFGLEIRDLATYRVLRRLEGHTSPVWAASWSADGSRILTSAGETSRGPRIRLSPGQIRILEATEVPSFRLWDAETGNEIRELFSGLSSRHLGGAPVALSPDGRLAALPLEVQRRTPDNFLPGSSLPPVSYGEVYDLETMAPPLRLEASDDGRLLAVDFSDDGRLLTTVAQPGVIRVWDPDTGERMAEVFGRSGRLVDPPDANPFVISYGDPDGLVTTHPLPGGSNGYVYREHQSRVEAAVPVSEFLMATLGSSLRVWDRRRGRTAYAFDASGSFPATFTRDGRLFVTAGRDFTRITPAIEPLDVRQFGEGPNAPVALSISEDGLLVVTVGWNLWLRIFDLRSTKELMRIPLDDGSGQTGPGVNAIGVGFLPWDGGYRVAVGDTRGWVRVYDIDGTVDAVPGDLEPARIVPATALFSASVFEVARNGSTMVRQGLNQPMQVLGPDLDPIVTFNPDPDAEVVGSMSGASLSPSGDRVAFVASYVTAVYDTRTGERLDTLGMDVIGTFATAFSPDGSVLAAGGSGGEIVLYDLESKTVTQRLRGHPADVFDVEFSPDGALLASGSSEFKVHDVASGRELQGLDAFSRVVTDSEFTQDGTGLVVSTENNLLAYFDLSRPASYDLFAETVPAALATLRENPADGESLRILAEWYAFRGLFDRAAEAFESAAAVGAAVDELLWARTLWQAGRREDAHELFLRVRENQEDSGQVQSPKEMALLALLIRATDPERPEPGSDLR